MRYYDIQFVLRRRNLSVSVFDVLFEMANGKQRHVGELKKSSSWDTFNNIILAVLRIHSDEPTKDVTQSQQHCSRLALRRLH